ncbi:unnamed protein product [Urochloa humidicola]
MYRKRRKTNSADLQAIKDELKAEVTQEVKEERRAQISKDLLSMLASQGLQIVQASRHTSLQPVCRRSSYASASALQVVDDGTGPQIINEDEHLELMPGWSDGVHGDISLLTEPTPCAILHNVYRGGDYVQVAIGQVYPQQTQLHTVPMDPECAVVKVEHVLHPDFAGIELPFPPNDEISKLGEAILQRIQWNRTYIVVRPRQDFSSPSVGKDSTKTAAKSSAGAKSPLTPKSAAKTAFKKAAKSHSTPKKAAKSPSKSSAAAAAAKSAASDTAAKKSAAIADDTTAMVADDAATAAKSKDATKAAAANDDAPAAKAKIPAKAAAEGSKKQKPLKTYKKSPIKKKKGAASTTWAKNNPKYKYGEPMLTT